MMFENLLQCDIVTYVLQSPYSNDIIQLSRMHHCTYKVSNFQQDKNKLHAQTLYGQTFFTGTVPFQKITRYTQTEDVYRVFKFYTNNYKFYLHLKKHSKERSEYNNFALDYQSLTLKTNN